MARQKRQVSAYSDPNIVGNDVAGAIGEAAFGLLCLQTNRLSPAVVYKDKDGWDYYLQWPFDYDSLDPGPSCKVQVKTTRSNARSASIKLSNWQRMAYDPLPWFVAALSLDGVVVKNVHVVHVDEELVRKTALKLIEVRGTSKPLNKIRMAVAWNDQHKLATPLHGELYRCLSDHIGPSEDEYRKNKNRWIAAARNAAKPRYKGSFKIDVANGAQVAEFLARLAIGDLQEVPIKDFEAALERFEGAEAEATVRAEAGVMTIERLHPDGQTLVSLTDGKRANIVRIEMDTYFARSVFRFLPPEHNYARFSADLLSFVMRRLDGRDTFTANIELPPGNPVLPLSTLGRMCRAARMIAAAASQGLAITFEGPLFNEPVTLDISNLSAVVPSDFLDFASIAERASELARTFALDLDSISLKPSDLLRRRFAILAFSAGLDRSLTSMDLRVGLPPDEDVAGKRAALIVPCVIPLGSDVIVGVFSLAGIADMSRADDGTPTMGIANANLKLRFKQIVSRRAWNGPTLRKQLDSLEDALEAEGCEVVVTL